MSGVGRESLDWLTGDLGDDLKVFVEMQNGEPDDFGGRSDEDIRDRGSAVLTDVGKCELDRDGAVLDPRREVLHGHRGQRWSGRTQSKVLR